MVLTSNLPFTQWHRAYGDDHPLAVSAARFVAPNEWGLPRASDFFAAAVLQLAFQAIQNMATQLWADDQLGRLRPLGHKVGFPLRDRCPIVELATACCSIARQLSRAGRGASAQTASYLPHTDVLGSQQGNLLALCEGQVPLGARRRHEQWHAATMPEPARASRLRHADGFSGFLAPDSGGNLLPDAYDNAMAESFFATLECELIERRSFRSKAEAKAAVFSDIEGWYNPH